VTLLRTHLAADEGQRNPVFLNTTPEQASSPLPEAVRDHIAATVGPSIDVRWVTSRKSVTKANSMIRGGGYYGGLPQVPADRGRYRLSFFTLCGGLCGYGNTYLMTERAGDWHARAVGPMVIA